MELPLLLRCLEKNPQVIARLVADVDEERARWRPAPEKWSILEIINHLYTMLDLDKGGEMASNLEALYTYMLLRLPDVDIKNDARPAEEVIEFLEPLRSSWKEFARNRATLKIDRPITGSVAGDAEARPPPPE